MSSREAEEFNAQCDTLEAEDLRNYNKDYFARIHNEPLPVDLDSFFFQGWEDADQAVDDESD